MLPPIVHEVPPFDEGILTDTFVQQNLTAGTTISIGNTSYTIFTESEDVGQSFLLQRLGVVETTFNPLNNTYSSIRTDTLEYESSRLGNVGDANGDGVVLTGFISSDSRGFQFFEINGEFRVVDVGPGIINIFDFDPDAGKLTPLNSITTPSTASDATLGGARFALDDVRIHVSPDGSGFTLIDSSSQRGTPNTVIVSQRFDADGQLVGGLRTQDFQPSLRSGPTALADVDDGAGGTRTFLIADHDRSDSFGVARVTDSGFVLPPTEQVPLTGSNRTNFEAFSARVPQDSGPDRTFVYFSGVTGLGRPQGIDVFEVDINGNLTFVEFVEALSSNPSFSQVFVDGAGTTFVTVHDDFYRVNSDGTLDKIAVADDGSSTGRIFDFTVLNDSLHVVYHGGNGGGITYHDLNVPAVPLPPPGPVPCFVAGTLIETDRGPRPIETLVIGDMVLTMDHGLQPIRWIGDRVLSGHTLRKKPNLVPIRIAAHAFGQNVPATDLIVSPQHRMLVSSRIVQRMTGEDEILIPAVKLLGFPGVERVSGNRLVHYFHILLDRHEIITANGAPTESLLIGEYLAEHLDRAYLEEMTALFPDLFDNVFARDSARMIVKKGGVVRKLLERHEKNGLGLSPGVLPDQINVEPLALHMA